MEDKLEISGRFAQNQLIPSRAGLIAGLLLAGHVKSVYLAFTFSEKSALPGVQQRVPGEQTVPGAGEGKC